VLWKNVITAGITNFQTVEFGSVALTGGNATFSPGKVGFGTANSDNANFMLDNISEQTAGSGIIMNGFRTLVLNGNNSFTGGVTINSGVLRISNAGALNSATPQTVTFSSGSTGTLRLAGTSVTGGGLATNATTVGTPVVENASNTPATLTVNPSGSANFAGVLQNGTGNAPFSFAKTGTGTQTLSGANTYTGTTTVNGGTLALSSASSSNNISASTLVTVGASGTLSVTGLSGGGLTLGSAQTLANNGIVSGTVTVPNGSFVAGTGTYSNNVVFTGGAEKVTISGATSAER
jgi:fibronectin-binding autotransporter adhesin